VTTDDLLQAFVARDHSRVAFTANARYTENGQTLKIGDGLWGTLTGYAGSAEKLKAQTDAIQPPPYRIDFVDSAPTESVYFGGSLETTTPGMLALRVKTQAGRVSEIEAICVRMETPGERGGTVTLFQPPLLAHFEAGFFTKPDPRLLDPGKPTEVVPHSVLTASVDRYFDAVKNNDSSAVDFAAGCQRRDNGVQATNNLAAAPLDPAVPAYRPFSLSCAEQIDSGFFRRISRIRGRRHIVVDDRRGLVLTIAMLDQPGDIKDISVPKIGRVNLPSGLRAGDLADSEGGAQFYVKRYEPNFCVPMTEFTVQLTKIENGRVAYIESISRPAPFGVTDGWSDSGSLSAVTADM
jgi:hypothetical protein